MTKVDPFALPVPSEDDEQQNFVSWLDQVGLRYTAVPNHTYNPHKSQQNKNRRLGLRKGFPDMIVLVDPDKSKDGHGHFLAIEMKRVKRSDTSPEQKAWVGAINALESPDVEAAICKGAQEAIWMVSKYIHPATGISPF